MIIDDNPAFNAAAESFNYTVDYFTKNLLKRIIYLEAKIWAYENSQGIPHDIDQEIIYDYLNYVQLEIKKRIPEKKPSYDESSGRVSLYNSQGGELSMMDGKR